jgi:hypothetical protein
MSDYMQHPIQHSSSESPFLGAALLGTDSASSLLHPFCTLHT